MEPIVSIVIPVFNDRLVVEAVESALNQTYKNIEVIVVDDGSEGFIEEILGSYLHRIRYFKTHNRGAAAARNSGVMYSRGSYIAFLDSDDLFMPDKIEKQLAFMKYNKAVFSYTGYKRVDLNTSDVVATIDYFGKKVEFPGIISGCTIAMPTVMLDKSIIKSCKLFREDLTIAEDVCTWIDLSFKNKFYVLDEPMTIVRTDENSSAYNKDKLRVGILNIINHVASNSEYRKYEYEYWRIIMFYASLYRPEESQNPDITSTCENIFTRVVRYYKANSFVILYKKLRKIIVK